MTEKKGFGRTGYNNRFYIILFIVKYFFAFPYYDVLNRELK